MKYIFLITLVAFHHVVFASALLDITLEKWNHLEASEQGYILSHIYDYGSFEEEEYGVDDLPTEYKELYFKILKDSEQVIDSFEFDDYHARVGIPTVSTVAIYKLEGQLAGLNVIYTFQGCDMPDESSPYFETEKEALDAGCEFSDVSWSWTGSYNSQGDLVYDPGYPEWSGY